MLKLTDAFGRPLSLIAAHIEKVEPRGDGGSILIMRDSGMVLAVQEPPHEVWADRQDAIARARFKM